MRLIKGSLAGLVFAGVLAMMAAAAFAHGVGGGGGGGHGGGGGGHGFGGGGGGHAFVGGGGHAFGGFPGAGFSAGFSGTQGFSTGRFSGRGDHGRFGDRGFRGRDRDFRDFDGGFFDFGSTGFGYPDDSYYYPYSYYNDNGYLRVERAVQEELAELGYYYGPVDGTIGPETQRAIRWFQSVDKIPITGRIDSSNVVSAADQLRVFFLRLQLRQLSPADVTPDGRRFKKLGKSKTVICGSRSFNMFSVGF